MSPPQVPRQALSLSTTSVTDASTIRGSIVSADRGGLTTSGTHRMFEYAELRSQHHHQYVEDALEALVDKRRDLKMIKSPRPQIWPKTVGRDRATIWHSDESSALDRRLLSQGRGAVDHSVRGRGRCREGKTARTRK